MARNFYHKLMVLCDLSILHMYNEIRNTTECTDLDKYRGESRLGKRTQAVEDRLSARELIIDSIYSDFRPIERVVYKAIISASADNFKSDIISPYGFCTIFCVLLQITDGNTKKNLLKIIENHGYNLDDSFIEEMNKNFSSLTCKCDEVRIKNLLCHDKNEKIEKLLKKCKNEFNVEEVIQYFKDDENQFDDVSLNVFNQISKTFNNFINHQIERPLIVINTINIKGKWCKQFNPKNTALKKFYNGKKYFKVPMMKQQGVFKYLYEDGLHFLQMDLKEKSDLLYLVIILPDTDIYLPEYLHFEFKNEFKKLITGDCQSFNVDLEIPKFKIETECDLKKVFGSFLECDLMDELLGYVSESKSSDNKKMNIRQKAAIEFTESGVSTQESNPLYESEIIDDLLISYHCNRSFVFYLFDTRNIQVGKNEDLMTSIFPLLVGRYTGPNYDL
ncbi:serpin-type proteinase inhibitor 21 [Vairimorpha necatrix]|uniref:Serpin-type proteinase inhibitor 21 n=1 Tax=Vairimorpha necatrix TaxID=6039 RepID=A0AAX4JEG9_9MICR